VKRHSSRSSAFVLCLLSLLVISACGRATTPPAPGIPGARVETCRDLILQLENARLKHDGPDEGSPRIEQREVTMGGLVKPAIFAHPTSEIGFRLPIHPGARLEFWIGLDPDTWAADGDGATFELLVKTGLGRETLFSRHLNPAGDPDHRGWQQCVVDLGRFAGTTRELILRTTPGPADDPAWDWALWGDPRLVSNGTRAPADTAGRPHVILISLDTLRLDHLDACGHHRLTMPHLNRLLQEAVLFTGAHAPSHWTMPSHMSIFTSLPPDIHQVNRPDGTSRLARGVPLLSSQLQEAGYLTAGFATSGFLKGDLGFSRGFDRYCLRYNNARRQNELVRDWIWSHRQEDQFIFLHYFDAHSDYRTLPYDAPLGFEALWHTEQPEQTFGGCSADGSICASSYLTRLNKENARLLPEENGAISLLYDRGIRQLDYQLAGLVAWLKAQGLWDSSLVVLLSDHGEEFQEHGKLLHAQLFRELIEVPLIIKLPEGAHGGRQIHRPVEIIDVAPTILSMLGQPVPELMQGRSLEPLISNQDQPAGEPRPIVTWSSTSNSIISAEWKLVHDTISGRKSLFHLTDDPGEQHDFSSSRPVVLQRLHDLLKNRMMENRGIAHRLTAEESAPTAGFSDEERKRLELLGYVE